MIKIIAELGLNYAYGPDKSKFLDNALKLIDAACIANVDYVKFQKRTPILCVPKSEQNKSKIVPWHKEPITYLQYKEEIEFSSDDYDIISEYCKKKGISWFSSVWDYDSVNRMAEFNDETNGMMKIPSALINDISLIQYARRNCTTLLLSTGMSTEEEIENAICDGGPDVVFHTNSTYPCPTEELNLNYITWLRQKYPALDIGYSGHESKLFTTLATIPLGVTWIERHLTLDKNLWGSDQKASLEVRDMIQLVKGIRDIEKALGNYGPRQVTKGELPKRESLRGS